MEAEKLEGAEFSEHIEFLLTNSHIINNYFDNVMINSENEKIKNNRVSLLKKLENSVSKIMEI